MQHTNTDTLNDSNPDRRVDSSRRRAQAEAADEQARQRMAQARQEEDEGQLEPARAQPVAAPPQPEIAQAEAATDPLWQRWWEIQSNFVDDPRSSVAEAHALVSGIVDRVLDQLREQRGQLEQSWSSGKDISTEDLRHTLHGYRDFLGRLLSGSGKARS